MQAACNKCGTRYEFDAAAIPAGGYDAQCTHCGGVFFVAPESVIAPPPPPPIPPAPPGPAVGSSAAPRSTPAAAQADTVTVTCQHCGAVYQFAARDIPVNGYDAQCTQCHGVFFVSPAALSPALEALQAIAPTAVDSGALTMAAGARGPTAAPSRQPEPHAEAVEAASLGRAKGPSARAPTPPPVVDEDVADHRELLALDSELGEPAPAPEGASVETDFDRLLRRRRRRNTATLVVLSVAAAGLASTFWLAPQIFDLTVGRVLGIRAYEDPRVRELVDGAEAALLTDNDEGYAKALALADEALALDPQHPRVVAVAALARIFRGEDARLRAEQRKRRGEQLIADMKTLEATPQKTRPKDFEERMVDLNRRASDEARNAADAFGRSREDLLAANRTLTEALTGQPKAPELLVAAAIMSASSEEGRDSSEKRLRQAVEAIHGEGTPLSLENLPGPWGSYAYGRINGLLGVAASEPTRQAFAEAEKREPRLARARWQVVLEAMARNDRRSALTLAEGLLATHSGHDKTQGLIAELQAPPPTAVTAQPTPEPEKKSSRKKPKKRRR